MKICSCWLHNSLQAAVQLCIKASQNGIPTAKTFLDGSSAVLRHALNFDNLLLTPAPPGGDPCGATLWWWVSPCLLLFTASMIAAMLALIIAAMQATGQ
jgi:hypothetical protein